MENRSKPFKVELSVFAHGVSTESLSLKFVIPRKAVFVVVLLFDTEL